MKTETSIRPTKKQREILSYIEQFIGEHGYSPSYREIMNGLSYTSVATVSLHVNSLIKRGHLRKRDRSARSLEIVGGETHEAIAKEEAPNEEKWLIGKVEQQFKQHEGADNITQEALDELYVLVSSLKVLGMQAAAERFALRLEVLGKKVA